MGEYKIKDIETLTGIKSHTIRIWEKRYGILKPDRTETKIRTYSDSDLTEILNVAILNKNGWKISHIAVLGSVARKTKVIELQAKENEDVYYEKLLLSLLELDEHTFRETLELLTKRVGFEQTFSKHLASFLEKIGIMWIIGSISPAQEHFISNLIRQKIISETEKLKVPHPDSPKVMLYLPENELHEISLLFYHYMIRKNGVLSIYLGQTVPYDALVSCIKKIKPRALVTSVLMAADVKYLIGHFKNLKDEVGDIPIFAGGYQIHAHLNELSRFVQPISSSDDLKTLFSIK